MSLSFEDLMKQPINNRIKFSKVQFWALFRSVKAIQTIAENETMFPPKRVTVKKYTEMMGMMYDLAHASAIDCAKGECPVQKKGQLLVQEILEPTPPPKTKKRKKYCKCGFVEKLLEGTPDRAVKKGPTQKGPKGTHKGGPQTSAELYLEARAEARHAREVAKLTGETFITTIQTKKSAQQLLKLSKRAINTTPQLPLYKPDEYNPSYRKDPKDCKHTRRGMNGGCPTCGDPAI